MICHSRESGNLVILGILFLYKIPVFTGMTGLPVTLIPLFYQPLDFIFASSTIHPTSQWGTFAL
jgi:hypothetical protein